MNCKNIIFKQNLQTKVKYICTIGKKNYLCKIKQNRNYEEITYYTCIRLHIARNGGSDTGGFYRILCQRKN